MHKNDEILLANTGILCTQLSVAHKDDIIVVGHLFPGKNVAILLSESSWKCEIGIEKWDLTMKFHVHNSWVDTNRLEYKYADFTDNHG